jgi:RimJ/RimL family protein N-acetyltransferase
MIERWSRSWASDGLGPWVVRRLGGEAVIGYGGCTMLAGTVWNLGYRFAPDAQGQGYATELAHEALRCAARSAPDLPVVAYLVEHNSASARVAEKLGFELVHRGRDAGNPDPSAVESGPAGSVTAGR